MSSRPRLAPFLLLFSLLAIASDPPAQGAIASSAKAAQKKTQQAIAQLKDAIDIWEGGSNSLVAKAVGSAEGTRTPNGGKNRAYEGHIDPGNGVWNRGSFSYQHCEASCTPDEADRRQIARLKSQYKTIQAKAAARKINLNVKTALNGIDLANQSPLAALDSGGYVDRLAEAYKQGLKGESAILQARSRSFIDPSTGRLNAPGLGNNFGSVTHDQGRRLDRVSDAIQTANLTGTESPQ